jgi:hypothetical protein
MLSPGAVSVVAGSGPLLLLLSAGVTIEGGHTTSIEAGPLVGAPLERAVKSEAYALAIAKDRDLRWAEAAILYQQAVADWSAEQRLHPSAALERAMYKAERERQRSQHLAATQLRGDNVSAVANRALALDRGRLYRTKLMVVRAFTGAVPSALYSRTRHDLETALRAGDPTKPGGAQPEVRLLLCATRAAGGDRTAARLELAHVSEAERDEPANALPIAICHAALGDLPEALASLESFVLRQPTDQRLDPFALRDLYLANDWDRLRGDRRFESLFTGVVTNLGRY